MDELIEPLTAYLKRETAELHRRVEAEISIAQHLRSTTSYGDLLDTLYGIHRPFEELLRSRIEVFKTLIPDVEERFKLHLLEADMAFVGRAVGPRVIPICSLDELSTIPEMIGAFYVLEGSTIGGNMIATAVRESLGYSAGNGTSFYSSYGKDIGRKWNYFKKSLDAVEHDKGFCREEVLGGATRMFLIFASWFGKPAKATWLP
jgi:heme oxygenase (biliverdin-IX-beta and delta-forming)